MGVVKITGALWGAWRLLGLERVSRCHLIEKNMENNMGQVAILPPNSAEWFWVGIWY